MNEFDKDNVTYKDGYILNADGTETSNSNYGYTTSFIDVKPNTKYTIQGNMNNSSSSSRIYYYDKNNTFISRSDAFQTINTSYTFETPSNCTKIQFQYVRSVVDFSTIKIEQGTIATPYSPYGCGNVNEKVQNKNLFDENQLLQANGWVVSNGIYSGVMNDWFLKFKDGFNGLSFKENTQYTISFKGYTTGGTPRIKILYTDNTTSTLNFSATSMTAYSFTTPSGKTILKVSADYGSAGTNTIYLTEFQIEEGSTATSYVPHAEQNISFPLAQGQKFYEGSHPDDDEKVHHVSGEMLFDGSSDENWIYNPTYAYFYITTSGFKSADFCDNYSKETSETLTNNHFRFNPNNGNLYIKDERFTSASSFKTNLATNNIILQGELAEETTEDFTEEQKEAWKEWKKAKTYKNITHISSEDETPANVEITYVRDLETVINNLSN